MKPRERVLTAFDHREPDRVPVDMGGTVASLEERAYTALKEHLGLPWKGERVDHIGVMTTFDDEILRMFNVDFRRVILKPPKGWTEKRFPDGSWQNEWGLRFKKVGYYNEWVWNKPLEKIQDVDKIEEHTWPDLEAPGRVEGLEKEAKELEDAGWAVSTGIIFGGIFEIAWWLRGFDTFIVDLSSRQKLAHALLDKITDICILLFDQYLDAVGGHVQMVMFSDDYGGQTHMLLSPRLFREYIKPRLKRVFDLFHRKTDARIFLHSCGTIVPIIPDLIEIGLDVLNPVQPLAKDMDSKGLKEKFGDKLIFHGGVDIQRALPFGTIEEVQAEVKRRIDAFAPGGGYVFGPAHNIQPEIAPEKIITMYKAAETYGRYPIGLTA